MGSSLQFVSVIIPALNEEETIGDCLVSLLKMDYPPEQREILVVDNGSTDRTAEIVKSFPVRYLREERRGRSYARNQGIEASKGEILAFTDPDCVVSTKWLHELVRAFEEDGVGGVGGEVLPYPGKTPAERYAFRRVSHSQKWPMNHPIRPFAQSHNVAFRREVFQQIGLFDTRFPGGGWDDADLCWRFFRGTNFKIVHAPKAAVFHRYPTTAKDFFIMHTRYGYGLALIFAKYRGTLSWGWQQRLQACRSLGKAAWTLTTVGLRHRRSSGEVVNLEKAYFDFLRELGQLMGFLRGALSRRRLDLLARGP
ncbi:MAG: glycosyltransferase [bacterium]|nr:glycosyltransferase [bacterium]